MWFGKVADYVSNNALFIMEPHHKKHCLVRLDQVCQKPGGITTGNGFMTEVSIFGSERILLSV